MYCHRQVLNLRDHGGEVRNAGSSGVDFDAPAVSRDGNVVSESGIDRGGNVASRREVGLPQKQVEGRQTIKCEGERALDAASGGNTSDGRMIHLFAVAAATGRITSNGDGALCRGINLAIGAIESGQQEKAAFETLGVSDG